jgi:hypothetical protein
MKNKSRILWPILLAAVLLTTFFIYNTKEGSVSNGSETSDTNTHSALLSIQNLHNFYYTDKSEDIVKLSEHQPNDQKLKSTKLYRYSTVKNKMLFEKELFFDFKGRPILNASYSIDNSTPSYTHFYYDEEGRNYLEVYIGSNKYDTIYTLRNYNKQNHITEEIEYNIKRKELQKYTTWNSKIISDSVLRMEETIYDNSITLNDILPYYKKDTYLTLISPQEVSVKTARTVYQDTTYNSHYEDQFKLEYNQLVSIKHHVQYEHDQKGDWVTMKGEKYAIKRELTYYKEGESEVKREFKFSDSVLKDLNTLMQTLPSRAWKNHREKHAAITNKTKLFHDGNYGKSIEIKEAKAIKDFTPVLWHLVSLDSGAIAGFAEKCFVIGYNTPLKDKDGFNLRCLAIYEQVGDNYKLHKQSFNALETFNDYNDDFSFHDFNETNFDVSIQEGQVIVSYSYMRGEASYAYAYQNGKWVLVNYESNHRTCCQVEFYSYDYRTKMYHASISSTTDDSTRDTSINVQQNRPIMYMDSMNVQQFDYAETGLLIK